MHSFNLGTIIVIIMGIFQCNSLNKIDFENNAENQIPLDFKVEFSVKDKASFFNNFTRDITVSGMVFTNEAGWELIGYKEKYSEKKNINVDQKTIIDNKTKEYFLNKEKHDASHRLIDDAIARKKIIETHEFFLIFKKNPNQTKVKIPFEINFEAGTPWGDNIIEIEIMSQKQYLYWYQGK